MKLNQLGESDLHVTEICLGTMTWGEQNSERDAHLQLDFALDHGINFIDTAEMYPVPPGAGTYARTESFLGTWLAKQKRDRLVLASKVAGPGRRDWVRGGRTALTRENVTEAVNDSLARLHTDYLDLYQIHWPGRNVPMFGVTRFDPSKETPGVAILDQIETMATLIKAGKIRHYGLSNETTWGLCEFLRLARANGLPPPLTIQNCYSLVNRMFDGDLAEASFRERVPLLAYSPLAMGMLTGKFAGGAMPPRSRLGRYADFGERYKRDLVRTAADEYCQLAKSRGLSPTELAMAFVRTRWFVASTIIGATDLAQLKQNLDSVKVELDADTLAGIDAIHRRYPNPSA
ncbi:MAG: NADP(H)-dependent aldo-keto reductase [Betaproteobacteria bacterium]|nr:MAG: NADP(H)-dependent aldo-keto reductase [Betaproteobacteria bacterium]